MAKELAHSPLLRAHAPFTISGYRLFREIIDSDGAISSQIKALLVSVAAIARSREELALKELYRGAGLGLAIEQAVAGLIVLSSLRGEGAAMAFENLLEIVYGPLGNAPDVAQVPVAAGEARANFEKYFGQVPVPLQQMLRLLPVGADAYYLMRRGSIDANPLSPKDGEFLLLAILAADCSPMARTHIRGARNAGATDLEIAEAIVCAIPAGGIAAWMGAAPFLAED
ncbi:MAG: carboxymuconolactone decarboxylase family protein [Sphingorhabdus sp.]